MVWKKILIKIAKAIIYFGIKFAFKAMGKDKVTKEDVYSYIIGLVSKEYVNK